MHWISVFILAVCLSYGSARIFTKCELKDELHDLGVARDQLEDWVCMAQYESAFNTAAISPRNRRGSRDHGIFQINDYWNCDPENDRPTRNGCGHPCSDYRDEALDDDVQCIKQLYRERGHTFNFSYAWKDYCKHQNLDNFFQECATTTPSSAHGWWGHRKR